MRHSNKFGLMKGSWQAVFTIIFICIFSHGLFGQKKTSLFRDTLDQALDLSRWIQSAYGFVPLVSLITEPALGFGGAGGLIFVHRDPNAPAGQLTGPPSLSAVGGDLHFGLGFSLPGKQ